MKAKRPESKMRAQVMGIFIAVIFIVFVAIMTFIAKAESNKTVKVVRLKSSVNAGSLITADDVEEYDMNYKEFQNAGTVEMSDGTKRATIVQWEYVDKVVGNRYAASYLLGNQILYWLQTTTEQTKANSYLYSMDGELLNIQMETTNDFGEMVVPGDRLNIRCSYTDTVYDLPTEEEYMMSQELNVSYGDGIEKTITEPLFNEVTVLDMLNGEGESIYDIYYDFISMNKAAQQIQLESDEFKESVTPKSILLQVTAEEADRFMEIETKSPHYLITLLPRESDNAILDSLSDVQKLIKANSEKNTGK